MSTGVIIAIIVVVLILLALLFLLPRIRAKAEERKAQKELESRREQVATEHRDHATQRSVEADRAEQEAEIAAQRARAQRAEADRHEAEAQLHDRGLADDRLVEDHERERFSSVTGGNGGKERTDADAERGDTGARAAGDTRENTEYQQGREDEAAGRDRGDSPRR